ncbi:hypothetical protein I6F35_10040 [Bradyrhizobium sp. BRP22]|uniref:hypothetical protein n=1 Tax=Bradyrhizobium sp. BRP22 TaxID=2793821 RepID=UPI001CD1B0B9|nr:hypothetical protein [Bradyrhizobium sp. BRP22]MCA1453553.1 hypothetical protein [Bradyrhizobium sp. BRP22]
MNESSSLVLRLLMKSLGAGHPIRFAIGLAIGTVIKMVIDALSLALPEVLFLKGISSYQMHWYLLASAPLAFVPMVFGKRNAPESVVHTINTIQALLDRAKLSKPNEQMLWRALLEKYVSAATPELSSTPDPKQLFDEALKELPVSDDPATE